MDQGRQQRKRTRDPSPPRNAIASASKPPSEFKSSDLSESNTNITLSKVPNGTDPYPYINAPTSLENARLARRLPLNSHQRTP